MNYDLISNIGIALDNVYNNTSEDSSRKTVASLKSDNLVIEYRTILTVAKDQELEHQMSMIKSESTQFVNKRLKSIKDCFKECAGRSLKTKKIEDYDKIETLTMSPYSPVRTLKYSFVVCYEVN
tara:strand:- start:625 stop:996 length:372 start_codon:yes stop_codon:yes gene_type:complete